MRKIIESTIKEFETSLVNEEKAEATVKKYIYDITMFAKWLDGRVIDKSVICIYKKYLCNHYAPASVNSMLSSINSYFVYKGWHECKVKTLKIQKQLFINRNKELTKAEYIKLLNSAQQNKNQRLFLLMQTICSTGIRVSELKHITVEAVKRKQATINCKGKTRIVFLTQQLCVMLKKYIKQQNIKNGSIFITRNGKPLNRSNIWSDMKKLCICAGVLNTKVYPHNLRHLFARTYYSQEKDIVRLADVLGHSNINTTRIYTLENGDTHRKQLKKLRLLLC